MRRKVKNPENCFWMVKGEKDNGGEKGEGRRRS